MDSHRRRQGGRGRRLEGTRVPQLSWTEVRNPYLPMAVLSVDQLEAIHCTAIGAGRALDAYVAQRRVEIGTGDP